MSTPLLSMSHHSNWCHSAVAATTASLNTGNVSFKGQTSRLDQHNGNFVMSSSFAKSTSNMLLPSTAIFFQKIGCSMSLPILYSDKLTPTNDNLNDNSSTNEDDDSLLTSSLPNLKFFDQNFHEISQRLDSIDSYKDKNEFVESVKNKTNTVDDEMMDQEEQKNSRVDSLDIYKRRRSSTELDLSIVKKCFKGKDNSIVSDESNKTTIEEDLARLKIEMTKSSEYDSMAISKSPSDGQISNKQVNRKNSSMIPTLPDLELLSKHHENDDNADHHLQQTNHTYEQRAQQSNKTEDKKTESINSVSKSNRSKSLSVNYKKKEVRFADTIGRALENVCFFDKDSKLPLRRYSSYTPPANSEWNTDSWHETESHIQNNSRLAASRPSKKLEFVANNFVNPSLSPFFNHRLSECKVLLHSLSMAETTVYGIVSVMNIHYEKRVSVRYSFDEWQTYIDREATYMLGSHDGHRDKFSFVIHARKQDFNIEDPSPCNHYRSTPKMLFAICLKTGDGKAYWDNNYNQNYRLDLISQ
ncbi:uncharacterized protein LOC113793470 [Dermatophagoides pteronyssinus]|uniref:uncharacterized protein LOC113793470 n=1 Tax=Dermatophagoides pteronyssinus TaxID=6956 RepID=UPI003F662FEB